jgi:hypothetical protein
VPIISAMVILTEELWVKEVEAAHERRTTPDIALPPAGERLPEPEREREPA